MAYVVLARKWRPLTFADLVGQEHVSRTLGNAIATDRVAHAFLFTGVRGVGKTTSARILAKALNCENGPTAEPCLKCAPCLEIGDGSDMDVQEIDGASYNGVDEVRKLQDGLPFRPSRDRFKIYIVDEVHMLSKAAWNAFLKTLEEPPPHVKFIFATTEVDKVPVTILSRCQRYDFKLIGIDAIAERLREVLAAEEVEVDDEALRIVAREAAGSMRDAMSLLDQVIAWIGGSGEKLTADGVAQVLGVASRSVLHNIGAALLDGDPARCIEIVGKLAEQGFSLGNVSRDLLQYLRDLVVASVSDEPGRLIDLADAELAELSALAKRTDTEDLSRLYLGFSRSFDDIVRSSQQRGALEMALVRLSRRPPLLPLDDLLRKLAELEKRLAGGGGAGGGGASGGGGGRPRSSAPRSAPATQASAPAARQPAAPPQLPTSQLPPPSQLPSPQQAVAGRTVKEEKPLFAPPARFAASNSAQLAAAPAAVMSPAPRATLQPKVPPAAAPKVPPAAAPKVPPAAAPKVPPAAAPIAPVQPVKNAAEVHEWRTLLDRFPADKKHIASFFQQAAPFKVAAGRVEIAFVDSAAFAAQQVSDKISVALLEAAAAEHFGEPTELVMVEEADFRGMQTVAQKLALEQQARIAAARRRVEQHPVVVAALEVFGAELRDVRLPTGLSA